MPHSGRSLLHHHHHHHHHTRVARAPSLALSLSEERKRAGRNNSSFGVKQMFRLFSLWRLVQGMMGPRPVVLSGPSGAGKSTLVKRLMQEYADVFGFSVSHTTRNPRPGEVNGKDYHFVCREEMEKGILADEFIEHAEFSGNLYGTSKKAVEVIRDHNQICILDLDIQGVRSMKRTTLNPLYLSIHPPSIEALEERLRGRKTESEESIQKRLAAARADMEISKEPGIFDAVIINDDLDEAYNKLKDVLSEEIQKVQASKEN